MATLGPLLDTIQRAPGATIKPALSPVVTGEQRAIDALVALRDVAPLRYQGTLGEGGMGVVHLAEQVALAREVAVKSLKEGVDHPESAGVRLLQEGWITGGLEHPNVVPVYDMSVDEAGTPRIVLKRIDGVPWTEVLHDPVAIEDRFGATDALEWNLGILQDVCTALHFAHTRGVVHRDLKPDNVMIGHFGEVYLLDWGIAVSLEDDGSGRLPLAAEAQGIAGTPSYMAPEMLGIEENSLSARTDVYLLGAVLHEIVAGHPPHLGDSVLALLQSVMRSEIDLPPVVDPLLAAVCRKALSPQPEDRYADAEAFGLALREYLQHRDSIRTAERASRGLVRLREAVAEGGDGASIFAIYGGAQFGFRQALDRWPANAAAATGLRDLIAVMVEHTLSQGDHRSAGDLLAQLEAPPPELVARVEEARRQAELESSRVARLEELGAQLDTQVGARTRSFLALLLGIFWTVFPFLLMRWAPTVGRAAALIAGLAVGFAGLSWWARESLMRTAINRRMTLAVFFSLVGEGVMLGAGHLMGLGAQAILTLWFAVWMLVTGMVAINIDARLWISAVGYALAFLWTAAQPSHLYATMGLANALLTINAVVCWWPGRRTA